MEESRIDQKVEEITNQRFDELQVEIKAAVLKEVSELMEKQRKEGNVVTVIVIVSAILFFILGMYCSSIF